MVLVSIRPLHFRKLLFVLTPILGVVSLCCCFAQPVFLPVQSTPYDRQMARVYPVLAVPAGPRPERVQFLVINQWMNRLRGLPYRYSRQWKTPSEVSAARSGDCKGKAVALYQRMHALGMHNVRLVIGKYHAADSATHAWLQWETGKGNYILDPTFNRVAAREESNPFNYIPFYAYDGAQKYRAVDVTYVNQTSRSVTPPATPPLR